METYAIFVLLAVILFFFVLHRKHNKRLNANQRRAENLKRWLQE